MPEAERALLLARAIYALSGFNTDNLAAEVERIERLSSLCLPVEPPQGQEDAVTDIDGGPAPEACDLDGDRPE